MQLCKVVSEKDQIKIVDWAGNILFQGLYWSMEVDRVLKANKCPECKDWSTFSAVPENPDECQACDNTGYEGDFEVTWVDQTREDNVYEYINY